MRFLLSKLRIFLFFPIPYLSQPLFYLEEIVNFIGYLKKKMKLYESKYDKLDKVKELRSSIC